MSTGRPSGQVFWIPMYGKYNVPTRFVPMGRVHGAPGDYRIVGEFFHPENKAWHYGVVHLNRLYWDRGLSKPVTPELLMLVQP